MTTPFVLRFTNVNAGSHDFTTFSEAIAEGIGAGFEFSVWKNGRQIADWRVFGGLETF